MKKNDLILIGVILILAVFAFGVFFMTRKEGANVVVTVDGKEFGTYSLEENRVVEIESEYGTNLLHISNHKAKMEDATCPDLLCVNQHSINKTGETIVCLPNKVVVTVENGENNEVDITTQ